MAWPSVQKLFAYWFAFGRWPTPKDIKAIQDFNTTGSATKITSSTSTVTGVTTNTKTNARASSTSKSKTTSGGAKKSEDKNTIGIKNKEKENEIKVMDIAEMIAQAQDL